MLTLGFLTNPSQVVHSWNKAWVVDEANLRAAGEDYDAVHGPQRLQEAFDKAKVTRVELPENFVAQVSYPVVVGAVRREQEQAYTYFVSSFVRLNARNLQ